MVFLHVQWPLHPWYWDNNVAIFFHLISLLFSPSYLLSLSPSLLTSLSFPLIPPHPSLLLFSPFLFLLSSPSSISLSLSPTRTPLHCAASCNNVQVCKFLVESGAAVFAVTHSDMQTAADKCEEMEEGYAQCSQFLYRQCVCVCVCV